MQLIPARGRKLDLTETIIGLRHFQLIPARGRLPSGEVVEQLLLSCNLSPQGDGNLLMCSRTRAEINYNSSPQGDGNTLSGVSLVNWSDYNLSPQGDKKAPPLLVRTSAEGLCFSDSSVLGSAGGRSGGDSRVNGNCLDALWDVPLQGADLMQVDGDLLQDLFNALGIQRQNALAL